MDQQKIFLRAEWKNLLIANYNCDPNVLKKYIPSKTELDTFEGNHFVSLIAFQFLNTQVMGIKFPFHVNFVEVNLRFYVKHKEKGIWKRGVVFIKEIVPKFMITWIANTLFNENYTTLFTDNHIKVKQDTIDLKYDWGKNNFFEALVSSNENSLKSASIEEFITEHYWGYARINSEKTKQYAVEHPQWKIFPVLNYNIVCNFKKIYSYEFEFLQTAAPHSVLCAAGSDVAVRKGIYI